MIWFFKKKKEKKEKQTDTSCSQKNSQKQSRKPSIQKPELPVKASQTPSQIKQDKPEFPERTSSFSEQKKEKQTDTSCSQKDSQKQSGKPFIQKPELPVKPSQTPSQIKQDKPESPEQASSFSEQKNVKLAPGTENTESASNREAKNTQSKLHTEQKESRHSSLNERMPSSRKPPQPDPKPTPFFSRLTQGLHRSSEKLFSSFRLQKLDSDTLDTLEDLLISADLGVKTAEEVRNKVSQFRFEKEAKESEIRKVLANTVYEQIRPFEQPLQCNTDQEESTDKPKVLLFVGVNGAGKTTTMGKLASHFKKKGQTVMLAAGDTFRAAAIEQLALWGKRAGAPVISKEIGSDAAALAYDAYQQAKKEKADLLMIDTAGRLQNKKALMDELAKMIRVLKKNDPKAPHHVLLVLDASVGQNAHQQVAAFKEVANVTGLIMTKLDGTAKGGILVSICEKQRLPVHYIGVGEKLEDLMVFKAQSYAQALAGITNPDPEKR